MALNSYLVLFFLGSHHETSTSHRSWTQTETCWDQHLPCCTFIPVANMFFFHIFVTSTTQGPCFRQPTSENKGPVLIRKKCFAAVKRAESHPAATVLGSWRVSGCLKLDHPGIAAMAAMDIMILLKKDGMPLIVAQLRWNDVQTTVNIWKLIAFDPKGPWKSFRKSHRYRGFVWNPARFDGMHDLVQMVNENYRKNHKITGNMGFLAPFLVIITIFLWFS